MLTIKLLYVNAQVYRAGHSMETALHLAVYRIEEQLEKEEIMVGAFLAVEGAFNHNSARESKEVTSV